MHERAAQAGAGVKRAALLLVVLTTGGWGWDVLRAPDPDVEKGNQAFRAGKYGEALDHYKAAEGRGGDARLQFDRGAALYKLGEQAKDPAEKQKLMEEAEQAFERAADTDDRRLKSDAYHNLGNALYQRQRFDEAVDKYRRALRANPQNDAARYNLEMALRQRQKDEQKNQQQQQGQGQQQQQDQQQQGQGQGQQPQDQQQQPQQGQQQPQQGQGQQQPQQQDQQGQGQGQQQQQDQQQQPPQKGQGQGQEQKDPSQGDPNAPKQDPGQGQQQPPQPDRPDGDPQNGQRPDRPGDGEQDGPESEPPSDEDQKLDALEKRSRDLRKRLVRKGSRTRDPLRLPSRKDW